MHVVEGSCLEPYNQTMYLFIVYKIVFP